MDSWPPDPPENLVDLNGSMAAWCGSGEVPALDSILEAAEQLTPGTHLGISVGNAGTYATLAGTQPLVFMLDEMQYDLDEGPGLTAMRDGHTVIVDDAASEHRWPSFMHRAVALGLRSYLGVPIAAEGRVLGGLSMYSMEHAAVDVSRLAHARLFAAQAALLLGRAQRENDLVTALQSSRTIGKAVGLVMEQFDLDDHEAFAYLARVSQKSKLNLRDMAAHLVKQSNELRQLARLAQPPHQRTPSGLTLVPCPDAPDESRLDLVADLLPFTSSTMRDEIPTTLPDL